MSRTDIQTSKFLSLVLRHKPEEIGLQLDAQGWADVNDLITRANAAGVTLNRQDVERLVANSDKKRFSLSDDGRFIRAAQGHSVEVDLKLEAAVPPPILFHGTATRFVASIQVEGLKPMSRQQVHLSLDEETARRVGGRHGKPYVIVVDARAMSEAGYQFVQADNGVWLTDRAPPEFLRWPDSTAHPES
jgi:putative RNA 2'-phosphotransferase